MLSACLQLMAAAGKAAFSFTVVSSSETLKAILPFTNNQLGPSPTILVRPASVRPTEMTRLRNW